MLQVLGDSGPAVLLLPGGAEAVDGFYPGLIEGLMADPGCRVILYDRPGTGSAPRSMAGWPMRPRRSTRRSPSWASARSW